MECPLLFISDKPSIIQNRWCKKVYRRVKNNESGRWAALIIFEVDAMLDEHCFQGFGYGEQPIVDAAYNAERYDAAYCNPKTQTLAAG